MGKCGKTGRPKGPGERAPNVTHSVTQGPLPGAGSRGCGDHTSVTSLSTAFLPLSLAGRAGALAPWPAAPPNPPRVRALVKGPHASPGERGCLWSRPALANGTTLCLYRQAQPAARRLTFAGPGRFGASRPAVLLRPAPGRGSHPPGHRGALTKTASCEDEVVL